MTKLVAILNLTPDSFSDGGEYYFKDKAISYTKYLIENGCKIIDIGAESTRPNAIPLSHEQEWDRLQDIIFDIIDLCTAHQVEISIDSRHYQTLEKLNKYIHYINDVSGLADQRIIDLLLANPASKLILTHSLTVPADPNTVLNSQCDVILELLSWLKQKYTLLKTYNIEDKQIIFDPGIGFGKTAQQSIEIIKRIDELKVLNLAVYVGHSRKSFMKSIAQQNDHIDMQTLAITSFLIAKHIEYLRVHDFKNNYTVLNTLLKLL